ncbi:hypothetical protein WJX73_004137 [Symbiochloris irregularis]|uniref:Small integral membrane protein 8 n=1 Tax=Symbiochloris irregularis TaxID=706552 RepID=A0AAW1NX05_9CHLO
MGVERTSKQASEPLATTAQGTPVFKALNFELYAKPTAPMRLLAVAGTATFVGFIGYMYYQKQTLNNKLNC